MKNTLPQKRIRVFAFLKKNYPQSFTAKQLERTTGIMINQMQSILKGLLKLHKIEIDQSKVNSIPGSVEAFYKAIPGQTDITPILGNYGSKAGRETSVTQAIAWEALERDPDRFTQIEKVYSFLLSSPLKCFSRRQLEERLNLRANNLTSILNQLQEKKQVGIEKQDSCEYTGKLVYFYYAIDPKQASQKKLF